FFFSSRRRHTRSDRDRSSDVCSSDLLVADSGRVNEPEPVAPQNRIGPIRSRAGLLVTEPELLLTTTRYSPVLAGCALVIVRKRLVAFGRALSLNVHCSLYCDGLEACTLKVAFMPGATLPLCGC